MAGAPRVSPDDPYWLHQEVLRLRDLFRLVAAELDHLAAKSPGRSGGRCC